MLTQGGARQGRRGFALLAPLISHRFALDQAPEAMRFAIENPTDVMKVVIGDEV